MRKNKKTRIINIAPKIKLILVHGTVIFFILWSGTGGSNTLGTYGTTPASTTPMVTNSSSFNVTSCLIWNKGC